MFNLKITPPITFAEWGEQWMDLIITPKLIESNLKDMITPNVAVSFPAVTGEGSVKLGSVSRTNDGDMHREIVFLAPLDLDLKLTIGLPGLYAEQYAIQAHTRLKFILRALPMLVLFLDCPAIDAESISVEATGNGLADKIIDLEGQLKRFIAKEINSQIEASSPHRRIDVLATVRDALG